MLYGPYMAKISVAPVAPALVALEDKKIDITERPNALRDEVNEFFAAKGRASGKCACSFAPISPRCRLKIRPGNGTKRRAPTAPSPA